MKRVEVSMGPIVRGDAGKFSGTRHAFTQAEEVLKKYALLADKGNPADFLAKLFRSNHFGYDAKTNPLNRRYP